MRIFIKNWKFFFDSGVLKDNTSLNCAKTILNWRNKIAHQNSESYLYDTFEQTLFEIMAINRLFSLLPNDSNNSNDIQSFRNDTIKVADKLSKLYFSSETENKKDEENFEEELEIINEDEIFEADENDEDSQQNLESRIPKVEALQLLRKLKMEISESSKIFHHTNIC